MSQRRRILTNGTADQWHYEVYNLPECEPVPKGAIFPYWKDVNELPAEIAHKTKTSAVGLDFGFSNDPTAMAGFGTKVSFG